MDKQLNPQHTSLSQPNSPNHAGLESTQYISLYKDCHKLICDHSPEVLNAPRDEAFRRFAANGFPSQKVERYKYTDVAKLFAPEYGLNLNRLEIQADPKKVFCCDVPNLSTALFFVVNDMLYTKALPKVKLPEGVVVAQISQLPHHLKHLYNTLAGKDHDAITDLNTMLAQDALIVYVPKNTVVEKTIQVINILKAPPFLPEDGQAMMVNRRVMIVMEQGAQAKLLFCDHSADDTTFLTTQVIEVFMQENSNLELYCMEETHLRNIRLSNVYVNQKANSSLKHNILTLHNGVTRNKTDVALDGEGADCQLQGCVIADKQQHADNNTLITHCAEHCTSHELYKYVLDEQATAAFAGKVLVEKGAQHTESQMTNRNICTTKQAHVYTQPMLEIYADDVKCAHGSTVGQLNDAALFYMRQRGLSEKEARTLLLQAFVYEVIDNIKLDPLRERLHYLIEKRFRGQLNSCEGCGIKK